MVRLSIRSQFDFLLLRAFRSRPMSRTTLSPIISECSGKKNESLGNWKVKVNLACTMSWNLELEFHSPARPEGISRLTTKAPDSLIRRATAAKPPLNGSRSPTPNNPSITMSSTPRCGGVKVVVISVNCTFASDSSSRCFMASHSSESLPFTLKRYTSTLP